MSVWTKVCKLWFAFGCDDGIVSGFQATEYVIHVLTKWHEQIKFFVDNGQEINLYFGCLQVTGVC